MQLQHIFDEIDVYRQHGLFRESLARCREASRKIAALDREPAQKTLIRLLAEKIEAARTKATQWADAAGAFRMTTADQSRVRAIFSGAESASRGRAADHVFRVAEALYVFGQYDSAIAEFDKLLDTRRYRVPGAKGIIMSLFRSTGIVNALVQYRYFLDDSRFSIDELEQLNAYLKKIIRQRDLDAVVPAVSRSLKPAEDKEDLGLEILSVALPVGAESPNRKGSRFPVVFQAQGRIAIDIPAEDRALLEELRPGKRIEAMTLAAKAVFFEDDGQVVEHQPLPLGRDGRAVRVTIRCVGL